MPIEGPVLLDAQTLDGLGSGANERTITVRFTSSGGGLIIAWSCPQDGHIVGIQCDASGIGVFARLNAIPLTVLPVGVNDSYVFAGFVWPAFGVIRHKIQKNDVLQVLLGGSGGCSVFVAFPE